MSTSYVHNQILLNKYFMLEFEESLGFALMDVKAILAVAIRYGDAFSSHEEDAGALGKHCITL